MSNFPLIEAMGLNLHKIDSYNYAVDADELEKALQDAPLWYGDPVYDSWSTANIKHHNSHTARLVCIQPIKKKTKAEAAIELLIKINNDRFHLPNNSDLTQQAKKILEMEE